MELASISKCILVEKGEWSSYQRVHPPQAQLPDDVSGVKPCNIRKAPWRFVALESSADRPGVSEQSRKTNDFLSDSGTKKHVTTSYPVLNLLTVWPCLSRPESITRRSAHVMCRVRNCAVQLIHCGAQTSCPPPCDLLTVCNYIIEYKLFSVETGTEIALYSINE